MSTGTLEHRYAPRGAARRVFACKDSEVLLSGPAGTGKSRACLEKVHALALRNPGMRGLLVRKTLTSLTSTGLVTYEKKVAAEAIEAGIVSWYGGSPHEPASYRFSNGSALVVGGLDKPTKIMSSEYDVIYVQEATELTLDDWEALSSRLRNGVVSFQQLIADCNPDADHHWLNKRCKSGETTKLESWHEDNPVYFRADGTMTAQGRAYIEGKLDKLTGVRYLRLRKGLWVAAEGLVYEQYDPQVHLVDKFMVPDDWERWWTIDFGFVHPFVCQHWAEDPDGGLWLYREFFMTGLTVDQHAQEILDIVAPKDDNGERQWIEPEPTAILADHDAENRARFEREIGRSLQPAKKTVNDGIDAVNTRLRERRLHIMRDAVVRRDQTLLQAGKPTCSQEEIVSYIWDSKKEKPVKEYDDGMDGMRYMVAERDLKNRTNIRWLS